MKGIIALDIDGTTAVSGKPIANEVVEFLKQLVHDKWSILFITGRTLVAAEKVLHALTFPYFLAVQNGAIILEMPQKKIVSKKYLKTEILPMMQQICEESQTGFVIYSGCENHDYCYYQPHMFSSFLNDYFIHQAKFFNESWKPLQSFENLDVDEFSSVKCIDTFETATAIARKIEERLGLHIPLIRDVFNEEFCVAQATHPDVNKGKAMQELGRLLGNGGLVIAAGDDNNDRSMLEAADVKVVMATAPGDLIAIADVVAPPATMNGLIAGLSLATRFRL